MGRPGQARSELSIRLAERREEIEQAVLSRVHTVLDPSVDLDPETLDPEYREGLRAAVSAAVGYGLAAIERSSDRSAPLPPAVLSQVRMAARDGVSLDTVLRRYFAGQALLGDFMIEEAEQIGLDRTGLQRLLRTQAIVFDGLLASISEEYGREAKEHRFASSEQRRAERIERLLSGELLDASELAYDFEGSHFAAIATGPGAEQALRELSTALDRRLLVLPRAEDTVWAWLGSRREVDLEELGRSLSSIWPPALPLAYGEPGQGLPGWRFSHRQARAALPLALRDPKGPVRYGEVALLASILRDDLLLTSLRRLYLEPLEQERNRGEVLRETLRAYFAVGRNVSSAAALLGVSRQAVTSRIKAVEDALGISLPARATELEAALLVQRSD